MHPADDDSKPIPVLLIARGGVIDGAERQLFYLTCNIDRNRFHPIVLLDRAGSLADELQSAGVEVHVRPLRSSRNPRGFFCFHWDALHAARLAARRKIRLVHASDLWKSTFAVAIAKRLRIPSVVHIRGPITARDLKKHKIFHADAAISISARFTNALSRAGMDAHRIHTIDDAVETSRFTPSHPGRQTFREQFRIGERVAVGIVGRIEPFKRILEFLEIVACLDAATAAHAVFLVVGESGSPHYMREIDTALDKLALKDRVRFIGRRDDMPATIAGLDLLLNLSGGSVMFEAMASAKAILSIRADHGHAVHIRHDETAYRLTTASAPAAAQMLRQLILDAPLRLRLGNAARIWAQQHLSTQLLAARTHSLYEQLLAARR